MLTPIDIRWIHDGTNVFSVYEDYTIHQSILSNPMKPRLYSIYAQIDGDEVHLASHDTLEAAINQINEEIEGDTNE